VPKAAEVVLLRALAKDPTDRYPTAAVLVSELESALAGENSRALRQEARHGANETLAQPRALMPVEANVATTIERAVPARKPRSWGMLAASGVIVLLVLVIAALLIRGRLLVRNIPVTEAAQIGTTSTSDAVSTPVATRPPNPQPPPALYDVPMLRLAEARANLANNPTDPSAYLALARALLEQRRLNSQAEALQTVVDGLEYADDPVRYALTAGQLARDLGRQEVAFEIYLEAIRRAEGTEAYPTIREHAGAQAYRIASDANFPRLVIMAEVTRAVEAEDSALALALLSRVLIENGNAELANAALGRALTQNSTLAEAHLVLGELYIQQNRMGDARAEWESVLVTADAPGWARQRASALLQSAVQ
ncbi:MAG: hypothetical protein J0M07_15870, partial [Anaerolineae bacterium]|nr:hypothetical protein [Anaerolineae bacterium]